MRAIRASLILVLASGAVSCAAQATEPPRYSLKADGGLRARYGPVEIGPLSLPHNRPYSELTPEQKEQVKDQYERMAESDEPPFPLAGLGAVYEPIAKVQSYLGVKGRLLLEVVIDSGGMPVEVRVHRSPDRRVAKAIGEIAMLTRFKPAVCEGRPCRMSFPIDVEFTLR